MSAAIVQFLSGLDGNGVRLHLQVPTHAILKIQVGYAARIKDCMACFSSCSLFTPVVPSFLVTIFTISFVKLSVHQSLSFYLLFFDHVVSCVWSFM